MRSRWFFLFLLLPIALSAQIDVYLEEDPEPTIKDHRGLAYSLVETGSGLGLFYETPAFGFVHVGAEFTALIIRDRSEINYIDQFGFPRTYGKENNVFLLDLMFIGKWRLFAREFDDSFRPFITAGAGPVFGMNFPEATNDVQTEDQYLWAPAGLIGFGLDADVDNQYFFGFRAQYRIIPFSERLGERTNHSMIDIRLEIGQRF